MPALAEIEQQTRIENWRDVKPKEVVNFDPWIYALNEDRLPILREDVEKYLAECLMLTTPREAIIDKDKGFLHASGATYNELFSRSIAYYESNPVAVERFRAEWNGFLRAQKLIEGYLSEYEVLPPFVLASPPGDVYDIGEKYTKSLTYVGLPKGFDSENRPIYTLYSIPTPEIDVSEHWNLIDSVANVQMSLAILAESMTQVNANTVVAMPVIIESIDESTKAIARALDLDSWERIVSDAKNSELLDGQYERTKERRRAMLDWSVEMISGLVRDGQAHSEFDAVQEIMRQVFSAERGAKYSSEEYRDNEQVLLEMEKLFVANGGNPKYAQRFIDQTKGIKNFDKPNQLYDWVNEGIQYEESIYVLALNARRAMMGWIGGNDLARDSYVGTGCGSAGPTNFDIFGRQDMFSFGYQQPTYAGFDIMQNGYVNSSSSFEYFTTSTGGNEPEGRHKSKLEYKPGVCVHCHKHREKVGYSKNGGGGCSGWCTTCEHADAAGTA